MCNGTFVYSQRSHSGLFELLLPTNSYSVNIEDDTITLAEEQYCDLKKNLEKEATLIEEESFEVEYLQSYMNRRGRAVRRPTYLDDYI